MDEQEIIIQMQGNSLAWGRHGSFQIDHLILRHEIGGGLTIIAKAKRSGPANPAVFWLEPEDVELFERNLNDVFAIRHAGETNVLRDFDLSGQSKGKGRNGLFAIGSLTFGLLPDTLSVRAWPQRSPTTIPLSLTLDMKDAEALHSSLR